MNDPKLKDLLLEWEVRKEVPATFNASVWRKIEQVRPNLPKLFLLWLEQFFTRPAVAISYSAVALLIGVAAGQIHASRDLRSAEAELQYRYIHSIDPYAKPMTK